MTDKKRHCLSLELDKVLDMLASHVSCEDARIAAKNLEPETSLPLVQAAMKQTVVCHL